MSIAVIIPARDAERVLPHTLAPIDGVDEVIVVDNASRDTTAATALVHGARVVHEPRPGRPRARNTGVRATRADKLLFLDADCTPHPGWARAMARALDEHPIAGGRIVVTTSAQPNRPERFDAGWRFRQDRTIATSGYAVTANLAIRRETFEAIGGFDEAYVHAGEDVDLCRRAGRPVYVADAVVEHAGETTLRAVLARGRRHGHGNVQLRRRAGVDAPLDWRHPGPIVRGDFALTRFGLTDPTLLWLARAEYAARVLGSLEAQLRAH